MDCKQQARNILEDKAEAPNQFVEFLVKRAKESRDEGTQLVAKIKEAKGMLAIMQNRAQELQGAINTYVEDIETWLAKESGLDAEAAAASTAEGKPNGKSKPFTDEERKALLGKEDGPKTPAP